MKINNLKQPAAITMWDSSWLRRRYAGGGFEDYDKALDELVERGYNAVRIDAFPHMIANAPDGTNAERFLDPTGFGFHWYGFAQWGSPWTIYIYPRRDIVEFLKKCEQRNVYVILSTWLKPTSEPRNDWMNGTDALVRVWDETLKFLQENDCLKPVIGVDIQNEIPTGACNTWLYNQLNSLKTLENKRNKEQIDFYRNFFGTALRELRKRWPEIPFSASQTQVFFEENADMDYTGYAFLDVHIWAEECAKFPLWDHTNYKESIRHFGENLMSNYRRGKNYSDNKRMAPPDIDFERMNEQIHESWYKNRSLCEEWLEERIAYVAEKGKSYRIPVGNTEGWGSVFWVEHPMLSWDMVKDAGMIAAKLGSKYGYTFNCQSNFCEPQFASLWKDVAYHQELTNIIKGNLK